MTGLADGDQSGVREAAVAVSIELPDDAKKLKRALRDMRATVAHTAAAAGAGKNPDLILYTVGPPERDD